MRVLMLDIEYREIPGATGLYVSSDGRFIAPRGGAQSPWANSSGYLAVKAGRRQMPVHRAVALAWVPNPHGKSDVNHVDGNKHNNQAENLEWCTRSENIRHALDNGLHACPETPVIGVNCETGDGVWARSQAEVGALGFQQPNVNKCLKGERKHHRGFEWRYAA